MRTTNDFEKCVSALKTCMINKHYQVKELDAKINEAMDEDWGDEYEFKANPTEANLMKERDVLYAEYRDIEVSYNEALELL